MLSENMVVSVEPGISVPPGSTPGGGFRHSDTVMVTADGCERLTRFTDDLDELILRGWRPLARLNGAMVSAALDLRGKRPQP